MNINGKTAETILNDIEIHISRCTGKYYSEYYIGVTHDPRGRLFSEHHVDENNDCWTYHRAIDIENARDAEKHMIDKGMKGATGGGNDYSIYVYCYHITTKTVE